MAFQTLVTKANVPSKAEEPAVSKRKQTDLKQNLLHYDIKENNKNNF